MPACRNCGNTDQFVLSVEFAVRLGPSASPTDPSWGLSLSCVSCASTDVHGDPVAEFLARVG